ncbi:M36 family metallopeptidase [Baekduia sp. Peel2402]|uniref:M36 family metallopeptidase n=1 Tax=Baekduia sp. Peel2402 TaxID=3458296 RepID=UPI00403E5819
MHRRVGGLLAIAMLAAGTSATSAVAADPPGGMDRRGTVPADKGARAARGALEDRLGELATVRTAPSGGVAEIGSPTRLLTGPSSATPEAIALGYVRDHRDVFRLDDEDIAHLQLVARSVSPDGITHLRYNQVLDGIESFDSGLNAHVTRDGRLISVSGAPLPGASLDTTSPKISASAGLGAARTSARGSVVAPAVSATVRGRATFSTGESAQLRWAATKDGPRLTWSVQVDGQDGALYLVQVDAADGTALTRTALTDHLGQAKYFVKDPDFGPQVQTTMPASWYDQNSGGTRLWGNFARTYVDPNDQDPAPGAEDGGTRVQIPASNGAGLDWLYTQATTLTGSFVGATPCPTTGCTWNSADTTTSVTNRFEAATNAHVLASRFHDYLAQAPIGFDEASGNFQRVNSGAAGKANDYVQVEINDGQGFNNANFATPADGAAPRMQMFLFSTRDANGADVADVVYHEYGHGLSNRLVVNAAGSSVLSGASVSQGGMMGEAWSDFYALDLLNAEGSVTDTAAPGEVTTGSYLVGTGGIRAKPIDCPPNAGGSVCDGYSGAAVAGGYTYGDIGGANNTSPHNGGEVWAETLWDLRAAVGRTAALALVTGGMRLSPAYPSMLDMRDAILRQAVAMRSGIGAADDYYSTIWQIFAARGMGASATSVDGNSLTPVEAFDTPSGLRAGTTTVTDPYPGGDADGLFEAGETISVAQSLTGIGLVDLNGVTGTLTTASPGAAIVDGSAAWPVLGRGRAAANADPLLVRMPTTCTAPIALNVAASSPEGGAAAAVQVDPRPSDRSVVTIPDNATATATFNAYGSGSISDVDVRIDELRHNYVGDLVIKVSHDGVTVTLFDPADNFAAADIVDLIVDDEAATAMPTTGGGPISGRRRPTTAGALAAFDGHPVAGTWTLSITDQATFDAGVLRRWGVEGPQVACSPLEIPAADTADAADVTQTSATARGSVTPNGRATGLRFAYGTTTDYGSATVAQDVGAGGGAVAGSAALSGLAPGTTYHVRAEAIRENGVVAVAGPDRTFTTASPPALVPPGPPVTPTPKDTTKPVFSAKPKIALAKAKRGKRAATATFALSEAATVKAQLTRRTNGVKSGKKCVKKTAKRKGKKCDLYVASGKAVSKAYTTTTGLKLALGSLKKGTYVVTLTATDKAGNRSAATTVKFTVK